MRIIEIKHVEDCFDGSHIFNYYIDDKINEYFICQLKVIGELKYYSDFPRPFFQLFKKNHYLIKGVLGSNYFQVIILNKNEDIQKVLNKDIELIGLEFSEFINK